MKPITLTVGCLTIALLALAVAFAGEGIKQDGAKLGPELLSNGDFEKAKKGAKTPEGWDDVDGLTSFYVKRPGGKGKCLKFDSDVYDKEAQARYKEMKQPRKERPPAKMKTPTTGKKYNTIAGLGGALLWSEYVEATPYVTYRLVAEVNTYAPQVKIFIKGYAEVKGYRRNVYKKYLNCIPKDKNELGTWKYYSQDFTPQNSNKKLKIEWIKVQIMVFWPPGEAYVDNISVKQIVEPPKEKKQPKENKGNKK